MHYGELKKCDIANGIGVRVTLFVSGCTNHCPDCFQPQTWDFDYGKEFTEDTKAEIFAELDKPFVNGLTVLGGEPFEPRNQREPLARCGVGPGFLDWLAGTAVSGRADRDSCIAGNPRLMLFPVALRAVRQPPV